MPETVRVERQGAVAHVVLNRPDVRNAFNPQMIGALTDVFHGLRADGSLRAILLRGEGKAFCAGGDLNWMREMAGYGPQENMEDARRLGRMLKAIWEFPRPVVARLHGAAYGGGTGITAAVDIAIAEAGTTFCFSEVRHGMLPAMIAPFVLRRITETAARRYFLTAEPFNAAKAQEIGLISEAVEGPEALDAAVDGILRQIHSCGAEAISATKRLIEQSRGPFPWPVVLEQSAGQLTTRRASNEAREGIAAFLEKRAPAWRPPEADVP